MEAEDIAKLFAAWRQTLAKDEEYHINDDTYCETKTGLFKQSLPVVTTPVDYPCRDQEVFVISDLHMGSGRNKEGVYKGSENFFADEAFDRFINHILQAKKTATALLVINGDLFDFLRVTDYPGRTRRISTVRKIRNILKNATPTPPQKPSPMAVLNEFILWSSELHKVGIIRSALELQSSISKKEKTYGLETDDYKAIYKLIKIKQGHPLFFEALGRWLNGGNKMLILKGNHDLEICWDKVRDYIRLMLAESMVAANPRLQLDAVLTHIVLPALKFVDDSVVIDEDFYVEHGHRYDKFAMVLGQPFLKSDPKKINIPFGSFFNRYVINRIELYYPYIDKVRPTGNVLAMLAKENFPLALKVIFGQIPFAIRMLATNPRYIWFMINRVVWFLLAILVPLLIWVIVHWNGLYTSIFGHPPPDPPKSRFMNYLLQMGEGVLSIIVSYLLTRLTGWFQLSEPDSLAKYAKMRLHHPNHFRIMTMGHTHNPGTYCFNDVIFYNTGTWIPVIEISDASVRQAGSYTFLHLERDANGRLAPSNNQLLQRWNDDACREDPQLLVERK